MRDRSAPRVSSGVWWLLARANTPWARRLRRFPVVGRVVHAVSHRAWPRGTRTPLYVRSGLVEGMTFDLDPRYESKLAAGTLETEVQRLLAELVRPGWTVWDVGASLGFFTLALARLVGPTGRVVAFEPDPEAVERLINHVRKNGFENVEVRQAALWSEEGTIAFGIAADDIGRVHARVGDAETRVVAVTLDAALEERSPPQLVKIDVEGAEEEVLRGGQRLLALHGPVVVCEVHLDQGREAARLERVRRLLEDAGYDVEQLDADADPTHLLARRPTAT